MFLLLAPVEANDIKHLAGSATPNMFPEVRYFCLVHHDLLYLHPFQRHQFAVHHQREGATEHQILCIERVISNSRREQMVDAIEEFSSRIHLPLKLYSD